MRKKEGVITPFSVNNDTNGDNPALREAAMM